MTDRNQNKPGYKETKIGWIPNEWKVVLLKDITKINAESLSENTPTGFTFYYLSLSDVDRGNISFPEKMIKFRDAPSRARRKFIKDDVLLSTVRPNLKGFGIVNFDSDEFICSTGFAVIHAKPNVDTEFLYHMLYSHETTKYFYACVVGSNYPALNNNDVEKLKIPTPPLPEQRKIAEILSAWDKAIELVGMQIEARQRLKKGLMQQLLTGKLRFPGFYKEWQEIKIGNLLRKIERPVEWDDEKIYDLISIRRRSGGLFLREHRRGSDIKTKNLKVAKSDDFLISKMQIVHGASALTTPKFDGMHISSSYISLVARNPKVLNIKFFDWLSQTPSFYHLTYLSSYGVHIEKMTFEFNIFLKRKLKIPASISEQNKIVDLLEAVNQDNAYLEKKSELLRKQKLGLMQKLLTGEVRVKV